MKLPSQDLFRLIQAMTAAEKRHFLRNNNPSSMTIELFQRIEAMEEYDEESLKQCLSSASFSKNLKVHKNRLFNLLLSSLRELHQGLGPTELIRSHIQNIEVFIQKKLYDLAYDAIQKAKKLCQDYEDYEYLLIILGIEARQYTYFAQIDNGMINSPIIQMQACLAQIQNYVSFAEINRKILKAYQILDRPNYFDVHQSLEIYPLLRSIVQKEIEEPNLKPLSPVANRMYQHCYVTLHLAAREYEQAFKRSANILSSFDENPILKTEKYAQYFSCLVNHLPHCINIRNFEVFEDCLDLIKDLVSRHQDLQAMYLHALNFKIHALKNQGFTKEPLALMQQEILPILNAYGLEQKYVSHNLHLLLFECCLCEQRYDLAGDYLLNVLEDKQLAPEVSWTAHILELIFHIEKGDWLLIDSLVQAHIKRLRRNNYENHLVFKVLNFCRKLALGKQSPKDILKHQEELAEDNPMQNAFWHFLERYFCYQAWVANWALQGDKQALPDLIRRELVKRRHI